MLWRLGSQHYWQKDIEPNFIGADVYPVTKILLANLKQLGHN